MKLSYFDINGEIDEMTISLCSYTQCPVEIQTLVNDNAISSFNTSFTYVMYNKLTNEIYAILYSLVQNFPNPQYIQPLTLSKYLSSSQNIGLRITHMHICKQLSEDYLKWFLNDIHLDFCKEDLTNDNYYIWALYNNELIFAKTKQDEPFSRVSLNNVSRVFLKYMF